MNNPNPFVPKGSLLEQQSQRRSRLKLAVFCVLAVSVTGLVAMLIQGCQREKPVEPTPVETNNMPPLEFSNTPPVVESNTTPQLPPMAPSNTVALPPMQPMAMAPEAPGAGTEYVIVAGDTLAKVAKAHGVTLKALEAANPGVDSKKLKIKQKITIPAATPKADAAAATPAGAGVTEASAGATYVVKSGDNLSKIAKKNHVTIKALQAANNMTTTHIKVGDKLKIPAKTEAAAAATPAPAPEATATPVLPPMSTPAPGTSTPTAPGH